MIRFPLALAVLLTALSPSVAEVALSPLGPDYEVSKDIKGPALDISGIACMPAGAGPRQCLLVNDENADAQFVGISGTTIVAGPVIDLIGTAPSSATLGAAPSTFECSDGKGKFGELDGEGVAYAAPYFYVVGSHGCSRSKNKFKLSSFILARIKVEGSGPPTGREPVETTYRLSDALKGAPKIGRYFAVDLQSRRDSDSTKGLNVEGVAVIDGLLYAGLRAPTDDGKAFIVEIAVDKLFAPGHEPLRSAARIIEIDTAKRTGIRDLAVMPDGKTLLVLTGPAWDKPDRDEEEDIPYRLLVVDPRTDKQDVLGTLDALAKKDRKGKAEAIVVLEPGLALVLFDSLENGGPRAYRLP